MKKTEYTLSAGRFGKPLCFAVVSDLHGSDPEEAIAALAAERPHYILMPGDITECLNGVRDVRFQNAMRLLRASAKIALTFYATGNHEDGGVRSWNPLWKIAVRERAYDAGDRQIIDGTGAIFLNDAFVLRDGMAFGGLSSGLICEGKEPNLAFLREFCRIDAPKILLCHHPEYYARYLKDLPIDLIVSGHAHGGQWRFFGRGVFAPGQGLFPKYTAGVHDDRLVISTGLKPSGRIPRLFNEPEIVFVHL